MSTADEPDPVVSEERDDESFLDLVFDEAVQRWSAGDSVSVEQLLAGRTHLREEVRELVRTARDVAPVRPPLLPSLGGYEIDRELGSGAMGTVYLARQESLDRPVALKVLSLASFLSSRSRFRFLAEARTLGRLRHPHVVSVHDVIEEGDTLAYAMDWIEGGTLAQVLDGLRRTGGEPTLDEVWNALDTPPEARKEEPYTVFICRLGISIARALAEVHRAGLVHRDVKPSNILIRRDGTPLLSDFGLVRDPESSQRTRTGHFLGTPAFSAPEQLQGEHATLDARADVYSLGVTLYQALSLRLPFGGESGSNLIEMIERRHYVPLRRASSRLPRDLDTIVSQAMDPEPDRRYATADELADDLERLLNLQPIKARPVGVLTRAKSMVKRNRRTLYGVIGGAAAVLAVGAVLLLAWMQRAGIPARVESLCTEARLALLDPDQGERAFASLLGGETPDYDRLGPAISFEGGRRALVAYDEALALRPDDVDLRVERDVVALAMRIARTRVPEERYPVLEEHCPQTCSAAARMLRTMPVPLEGLAECDPRDRRSLGLLAFLCGDFALCQEAWTDLVFGLEGDPLVDAALGQALLGLDEPGRAYVRLMRASAAFPEAGFLAVDLADAALRAGEPATARHFLERARDLGHLDRHDTLTRVEADVRFALGEVEAARERYDWMWRHTCVPPAHEHYARFLEDRGELEHAVRVWRGLSRENPAIEPYREELLRCAEAWWTSLDPSARVEAVARSLDPSASEEPVLPGLPALLARSEALLPEEDRPEPEPGATIHDLLLTDALAKAARTRRDPLPPERVRLLARLCLFGDELRARLVAETGSPGLDLAFRAVASLLGAGVSGAPGPAPLDVIREPSGQGCRVRGGGDANADSVPDLLTTGRAVGDLPNPVCVYSGADRSRLLEIPIATGDGDFREIAWAGDVNADGHDDVAVGMVGAEQGPGVVTVFSGLDGAELRTLAGPRRGRWSVICVIAAEDVDGDGIADLIVGAPMNSANGYHTGSVSVFSGADGSILHELHGASTHGFLGFSVSGVGDVDLDGGGDFLVGSPREAGEGHDAGHARLYSGKDGSCLFDFTGAATGDRLGRSVAGVGDVAVGAVHDDVGGRNAGSVTVFSGRDGSRLHVFLGDGPSDRLGSVLGPAGDVDGDGAADVLAGAPRDMPYSVARAHPWPNPGYVRVFSGRTGETLRTLRWPSPHARYGRSVTSVGDLDGDGRAELAVGVGGDGSPKAPGAGVVVYAGASLLPER